MHIHYDPQVLYECVQCGRGCFNRWDIGVEPEVVESLKGHPLELRVIQERGQAFLPKDGQFIINKSPQFPRCGFLQEDMLCAIHCHIGYQAKPFTCQQYPYVFVETPDGHIHASAVYSCTAVREEIGPPLKDSSQSIEDLLRRGARIDRLSKNIEVVAPYASSYEEIQAFEIELNRRFGEAPISQVFEEAILGLAHALATVSHTQADTIVLEEGWLASCWNHSRLVEVRARQQLQMLKTILTMGLLKPCLPSQDRQVWKLIDEAVLGDADLIIPEFNWHASLQDLDLWLNEGVGHRFDQQIKRFQSSLLFRKAHLTMGGLLPGLIMIWIMPSVIRLLTGLQAWKEQMESSRDHFLWALETAEINLVGHTFDTVPIYQRVARQIVQLTRSYPL